MAEMGLGYGSEYQLLRYLGHHRNELNDIINKTTRLQGQLIWLDYPKNIKRLSLDGEYVGMDFLRDPVITNSSLATNIKTLLRDWKDYWSTQGTPPNWDGVILHTNKNEIELVIVEAKAHIKEIKSKTESSSNKRIQEAFNNTQVSLNISNRNWFGKHYQLATRLALVNFFRKHNINASLLYIYFINGYEKRQLLGKIKVLGTNKSVKDQSDWEKLVEEEYADLGISEQAKKYISNVFIDCK